MRRSYLVSFCLALLALLVLVPGGVLAAPTTAHSPDFARMMAAMDELSKKSGQDFDIAYINNIIPHHQDAIEMSKMVQGDAPTQAIRQAAAKIIDDQQREIDELTKELKDTYGQQPNLDPRMKMSSSMMDAMMKADPTMREKLFLAMMREHHETALMMGRMVLQKSQNTMLRNQAQQMLTSQKQEQDTFGGYLLGIYKITPPTPTGDMQDGMDAVMMPMPAAQPMPAGPSKQPAPAAPATLPRTGGETSGYLWSMLVFGAGVLFLAGTLLRRKAR